MSEHDIQVALMRWFALQFPAEYAVSYATPNAGKRTPRQGAYLKAEGLKPGVPDLCIPVARKGFHGLYIELKTNTGRLTKEQAAFIDGLTEQGYMAVVCVGFESAKETIENYLKG